MYSTTNYFFISLSSRVRLVTRNPCTAVTRQMQNARIFVDCSNDLTFTSFVGYREVY